MKARMILSCVYMALALILMALSRDMLGVGVLICVFVAGFHLGRQEHTHDVSKEEGKNIMTQHTPGPWIVQARTAVYGAMEDRRGPYRKLIREALQGRHALDEYGGTIKEQEANARLIAAAPDLLEAAQIAYDALAFSANGVLARKILRRAIDLALGEDDE